MVDQIAVVTGASSGLGMAMVEYLLEREYKVYGFSRSGLDLDHPLYTDVQGDIRDESSVEEFFQLIEDEVGAVHLLVNNAGICEMDDLGETSVKMFMNTLETNTLGPFLMLKHLESLLVEGESHIVNILSTAAEHAYPNVSAYCASKYGMRGMLEVCQKEWKKYNVRFSNILPGAIDTPLWDKMKVQFARQKMLNVEDFMHVFQMVVESPKHIQFPEIVLLHKEGFLE